MTDKEAVVKVAESLERTAKTLNGLGVTMMLEHGMLAVKQMDELAAKLNEDAQELKALFA